MGVVHSLFPWVEFLVLETVVLADAEIIVSGLFSAGAVAALVGLLKMVEASSAPVLVLSSYSMQSDYPLQIFHTFCMLGLHASLTCRIYTKL